MHGILKPPETLTHGILKLKSYRRDDKYNDVRSAPANTIINAMIVEREGYINQ